MSPTFVLKVVGVAIVVVVVVVVNVASAVSNK